MPVLDASRYPHITDCIFSHASRDSLLSLRTASKSLRRQADAWLNAGRIVICARNVPRGLGMGHKKVEGSDKAPDPRRIVYAPHGPLPVSMGSDEADRPFDHDLDLQHSQVLDFVGIFALATDLGGLLESRVKPLTVRFMHTVSGERNSPCGALPQLLRAMPEIALATTPGAVSTFVLFSALPHLFFEEWQPFPPLKDPRGVPVPLQRAVVNISLHPADRYLPLTRIQEPEPNPLSYFTELKEAVWVFHRASQSISVRGSPKSKSSVPTWYTGPQGRVLTGWPLGRLLNEVCTAIAATLVITKAHTIIVGLESLADPWSTTAGRPWEADKLNGHLLNSRLAFVYRLKACRFFRACPVAHRSQFLESIKFMTLDEYRAMVGPERAALETTKAGSFDGDVYAHAWARGCKRD